MSISKLVVSLGRSFAAGMVYVALSRCTSREGLQVRVGEGQTYTHTHTNTHSAWCMAC